MDDILVELHDMIRMLILEIIVLASRAEVKFESIIAKWLEERSRELSPVLRGSLNECVSMASIQVDKIKRIAFLSLFGSVEHASTVVEDEREGFAEFWHEKVVSNGHCTHIHFMDDFPLLNHDQFLTVH